MLSRQLIHPDILAALGRAGHGSQVLIADGNYPVGTTLGPNAELVSLNLSPGIVTVTQVLEALVSAVPIESAAVMATLKDGPYAVLEEPPIWHEFRDILDVAGFSEPLWEIERPDFYDVASADTVALSIATGERRIYANLLLTIGVIVPPGGPL